MHKEVLQLSTEDPLIILRELATEADDLAFHQAVVEYPEYSDNYANTMTEHLGTLDQVKSKRLNSDDSIRMGIWKGEDFVGEISVNPDEDNPESGEIGLFVRKDFRGNGYASLALKALTPVAVAKFSYVHADVHPDNHASSRTVEKSGYIFAGIEKRKWGMAKVYVPASEVRT